MIGFRVREHGQTVSMFSVYALGTVLWMSVAISATVAGEVGAEAAEGRGSGWSVSRRMDAAPRWLPGS